MAEIPFLVKDLALILMVAGIVTLIFKRLKQPLVLGDTSWRDSWFRHICPTPCR